MLNDTIAEEQRFAIINEISAAMFNEKKYADIVTLLTVYVERNPDDPYNAYWMLMVAYNYLNMDAASIAAYYFDRILYNYPDLLVKDVSVHLLCLKNLIKITEDPEKRAIYYNRLISRFPQNIDPEQTYFMLARTYEEEGEWDLAIEAYTKFLSYCADSDRQYNIQDESITDPYAYARNMVDFNNSTKDWTFETLDELVAGIKKALSAGNIRALKKCQAKINFFAVSWNQKHFETNKDEINLQHFMAGSKIRFSETIDASSNPNEAYLRTWGWDQRIPVWYLYLRKVNFPASPEIHGRWEWAGIYFGEKM